MIVRVRGREGVVRVEAAAGSTVQELYTLVQQRVPEASAGAFALATDPAGTATIRADARTLQECGMREGEMLFLALLGEPPARAPATPRGGSACETVDEQLERESGRIVRVRNAQCCRHGPQGMCVHCQPLEPYDAHYTKEKGIKHLSLHSYLRKMQAGRTTLVVENPDFRVRPGCRRHPPYPAGICSQCQPPAITLNPQPFRFVDHVEFERPSLIERFLAPWRAEGYQRFAWLYGRYERYDVVPLGIKAVVCAMYEPPQDGSIDGFHLLEEDPFCAQVEAGAGLAGLERVGMMYTDLHDDGSARGKVQNHRNAETFFLSSAECIFIAGQQQRHPSPCRHAPSGQYGSKFVTVVLSGDEQHDVGLFAYQVSLACTAMVEADLVAATTEPSQMVLKPSTPGHYVPEVFYMRKDEYGSDVQCAARPSFPVDYFVVSLTHGFPVQADPLFSSAGVFAPPARTPSLSTLANYLLPLPADERALLALLSDFNLLVFLAHSLALPQDDLALLAAAIRTGDIERLRVFARTASWTGLVASLQSQPSASTVDLTGGAPWTCPHCTFINAGAAGDACEVCGLPRAWTGQRV